MVESHSSALALWMKALRLHQWLKNLLLFVPLFIVHEPLTLTVLGKALLAWLLFGLCASSAYLLNDLLDIEHDRQHPRKKLRPFAVGSISSRTALVIIPLLLLTAFIGSWLLLPDAFVGALAVYYLLTLAYSLKLKQVMILDLVALASLYTLRIIAGAYAFALPLTFWILAFSLFLFMSLALVKRYTELRDARSQGLTHKAPGRGYYPDDLEMLAALGAAAGYSSVLVLALYVQGNCVLHVYHHPHVVWLACPLLLFWISRVWLLAHRGKMHDDPLVFACKDWVSVVVGLLFVACFWVAA